jgi:hypothetical protein
MQRIVTNRVVDRQLCTWGFLLCWWLPAALPTSAATVSWINASGGNWNVTTNWSGNAVPGTNDDVLITLDGTYTVTLNANAHVNSLTLGGTNGVQTFSMNANSLTSALPSVVTNNDVFRLSGGSLNGPLTVATNAALVVSGGDVLGTLTVAPGGMLTISNQFSFGFAGGAVNGGGSLTNQGTVVWANGNILGYGNARIVNAGFWHALGNDTFANQNGTNAFTNTGTFEKSGLAGNTTVSWSFHTTGTINTVAGTLLVNRWTGNSAVRGNIRLAMSTFDANASATVVSNAAVTWTAGDVLGAMVVAPGAL